MHSLKEWQNHSVEAKSRMAEDETAPIEEKKKKRRRIPKSSLGRSLAWLSRANPDLVQDLNDYAKAAGKKPTQIIQEALHHYIYQRHIIRSELTVEELYEAWQILKEMQAHSVQIFLEWAKLMFSEEYKSMLELTREIYERRQQAKATPPPPPPKEVKDIQERFLSKMWNYLEPLLDMLFDQMIAQLFKATGAKKPPQLKGAKIPVNLAIEEEEPEIPNATKIDVE